MGAMASQITSLAIVYLTVYSGADQRKQQSSASLAFVRGIHRLPLNSPHKGPATRIFFPFDAVIMQNGAPLLQSMTRCGTARFSAGYPWLNMDWSHSFCVALYTWRTVMRIHVHHPKKVLGHSWLALLRLLLSWFSSEALSISPRVLINEVNFVGKSMSRIMNFNDLSGFEKIVHYLFPPRNNLLHRNKLITKLIFFMLTCDSFKM